MKKIVFISDYFLDQVLGGCELNDQELIKIISCNKTEIMKINSHLVTPYFIKEKHNNNWCFIISNFINLDENSKQELMNKNYIIYEHDHKYLTSRNPGLYADFKAPKEEIINLNFYKNAKAVYAQTLMHKEIIFSNLDITNIINLSGNLWDKQIIYKLQELGKGKKTDKFMILDSKIKHKNTSETKFYCDYKKIKYDLVSDPNYSSFLEKMSKYKGLFFFPKSPETLSRICVEARMLGLETVTNKNVGAISEEWYKLSGKEISEYMLNFSDNIYNRIISEL